MRRFTRLLCAVCAVCLLTGGAALAEEGCGIGEAAFTEFVREPAEAADPAGEAPESPAAAEQKNTAPAAGNPLETENSTRGFVYRMYRTVLGREPDKDGFSSWVKTLDEGIATAADLVYGFFNSNEYTAKGKNNKEIITDCYETMLNRKPDAAGLAGWKQALDIGMSADVVCAGFVGSDEFTALADQYGIRAGTLALTKARDLNYDRTHFVYRLYHNSLEREPETEGQENWCQALGEGAEGTGVAAGFIFSKELKDKHLDNGEFVEMLYRTILGREAEESGKTAWVDMLNYTSTREHVLNGFMYSPEFLAQCEKAGIQAGNPIAEPDQTPAWQVNIDMLSRVNAVREEAGKKKLTTREDLWEDIALPRAEELGMDYSDRRPDGSTWDTILDDAGMGDYTAAAENRGDGTSDPAEALETWMANDNARAVILDENLESLATAYNAAGDAWAQSFYTQNREELQLSAMDKIELKRAKNQLGLTMNKDSCRISAKDTVSILDRLIEKKAPDRKAEWEKMTAAWRKTGGSMNRIDSMMMLYLASTLLGEKYQGTQVIPFYSDRLGVDWETVCTSGFLYPNDEVFERMFNIGYGDGYADSSALYYNQGHISPVSGEFPFSEDVESNSVRPMERTTLKETLLGIIRLVDSVENTEMTPQEDREALEAVMDEEVRKAAENAEPVDDEKAPDWKGFIMEWMEDNKAASNRMLYNLKNWGMNTAWLLLDYRFFFDENDVSKINNVSMRQLDRFIADAVKQGMHVDIVFESLPGRYVYTNPENFDRILRGDLFTNEEMIQQTEQIFETLVSRYQGIPNANLSFGPLYETTNDSEYGMGKGTIEDFADTYERIVQAIRRADPDRLIVFEEVYAPLDTVGQKIEEIMADVPNAIRKLTTGGGDAFIYRSLRLDTDNVDDKKYSMPAPTYPIYDYAVDGHLYPGHELTLEGPIPAGTVIRIYLDRSDNARLSVTADQNQIFGKQLGQITANKGGEMSYHFPYARSDETIEIEIGRDTAKVEFSVEEGFAEWCGMDVVLPEKYQKEILFNVTDYDVMRGVAEESGPKYIQTSTIEVAPYGDSDIEYGKTVYINADEVAYTTDVWLEESSKKAISGWMKWVKENWPDTVMYLEGPMFSGPSWEDAKEYLTDVLDACREQGFGWYIGDLFFLTHDDSEKAYPGARHGEKDGLKHLNLDYLELLQEYCK